jgi:hypothetical protein
MDSSEIWLNRGAEVKFRGERYVIAEFDSQDPGQNRVTLRRVGIYKPSWPVVVEQQFFWEIVRA